MARGDRLAVERTILGSAVTYLHHGIDVGEGLVVHARPDDFRNPFAGGRVVCTSQADFAAGRPVRTVVDPPARFSAAEIADRAATQVGREGYSPVVDNCEHFATWCATGERASRQVDLLMARATAIVSRTVAVVSARAAAGAAERVAVRTAFGTTLRFGMRSLVPAAIVAEAAALAAEWRAHQAGLPAAASRRIGNRAGLAATAAAFAVAGFRAGPVGIVGGVLAGAAVWTATAVDRGGKRRDDGSTDR